MDNKIDDIIQKAFDEDLKNKGDITTMALFDDITLAEGEFVSESSGSISGLQVLERCFKLYDRTTIVKLLKKDGDKIMAGEKVAEVKGRIRSLLAVERVALNFLAHMSGITTVTKKYAVKLQNTSVKLKDTRKTTPGLRIIEKMAVKEGGGLNHRLGLYDGLLIKDNHIEGSSIKEAINKCKDKYPTEEIEVEVETLDQVKEAVEAGADIVLLDNMSPELVKEAVVVVNGQTKIEVSGGVNFDNIEELAQTGVDFISTSAITMGAPPLNFKFELM